MTTAPHLSTGAPVIIDANNASVGHADPCAKVYKGDASAVELALAVAVVVPR